MKKFFRDLVMNSTSLLLKTLSLFIPKQKNLILFGSFAAKKFGDNSAALFKQIVNHHSELEAIWMTNSNNVVSEIELSGWSVLKRKTLKGVWKSLRANIVITTHGIKDAILFEPLLHKPKWIYLHHGIIFKKGWFDVKNASRISIKSSLDKINRSDFMIATSEFAAELQNRFLPIGLNKIKKTGLPRNDIFFDDNEIETEHIIKDFGLKQFKYIVLYAPTWRDWGSTKFFPFTDFNLSELVDLLIQNKICIILRPHHVDLQRDYNSCFWNEITNHPNFKIISNSECSNANVLCKIADCLITDYSSIFFDYLLLDKPMVFIPYDIDRYEKEHGFLVDYDKYTNGPKLKTQKEFVKILKDFINGKDEFGELRNETKNKIHKFIDGNSSRRIVELIKGMIN